jgi:hypothetical protein
MSGVEDEIREIVASRDRSEAAYAMAFANQLAATCSQTLGVIVASTILHGSLALGDYLPGHSDVDLLLIVDRPLSDAEIDTLVNAVLGARERAPLRVDLRVITREVAAAPPDTPPMELYIRLDPAAQPEIVSKYPGEPDLIVELSLCRQCGKALLGARRAT